MVAKILLDYKTGNNNRGFGDILISTPIIQALSEKYSTRIDCLLRYEAHVLLLNNPYVRKLCSSANIQDYDLVLRLGYWLEDYDNPRNRQPRVDSIAELFGVKLTSKLPRIYHKRYDTIPNSIGISIESTDIARQWRPDYLIQFMEALKDKCEFHVFGTGERIALPNYAYNYIGKLSLGDFISQLSSMNAVLTVDSLASHLAAAYNIPSIILYTAIPKEWRCSYYPKAVSVQAPLKCSPCWARQNREQLGTLISECEQREGEEQPMKCVDSITPQMVLEAYDNLL